MTDVLVIDGIAPLGSPKPKKKKAYVPRTPTAKAMAELRAAGWEVEKVEQRLPIPGKFVTRDLFDCIDLVAMQAGKPLLAVQATTRDHVNHRMVKALTIKAGKTEAYALTWVRTGNSFEIWGYGGVKTAKRVVGLDKYGDWMEGPCSNISRG